MGRHSLARAPTHLRPRAHDRRGLAAGVRRAAGTVGPAVVLTFESSGDELEALSRVGHPFFKPPWRATVVGMLVDGHVDWAEVTELITESHRLQAAPRRRRG